MTDADAFNAGYAADCEYFRWLEARTEDWHWFDHPEMQARIARAEADLREGRYTTHTSAEALIRYLHRTRQRRRTSRYIAKGGVRK